MQHDQPEHAQSHGAPSSAGLGMPNSGLLVINPSQAVYDLILAQLGNESTLAYNFPDQSLLADVFSGRWAALPYTYNALKTMQREDVHAQIWRENSIRNIHYILSPKPWEEEAGKGSHPTHDYWWKVNVERLGWEKQNGIQDGS
jgi:lipopolysaccharide biosynthesis glycosyltransferase